MTFRQRMLPCTLAAALMASTASGASIHGHLSSVVEYYDEPDNKTALPVYQYLLLHANDIADKGFTFRFYGRAATDLHDNDEVGSHLYYAYLEKRNMADKVDFKLGRHFVASTAGAAMMDGLSVDVRNLGPVSIGFFGGGDVKYYEDYKAGDMIAGAKISTDVWSDRLHLGLSTVRKYEESELSHELYGFNAYLNFDDKAELYTETQYDYLSDTISYFLAGANYHAAEKWTLRGEYLYSLPVFSSKSLYSVFAVSEYKEIMTKATYRINLGLSAFAKYTHEMYEDFSNANVYEAGLEQVRLNKFSGYFAGVWRSQDEGQDLKGVRGRAAWLFTPTFQAGVGASVDVMERWLEIYEGSAYGVDETTSHRIWVDSTLYLGKRVTMEFKIEQAKSALWDKFHLGRVRLNYYF
ncbi:hypothetical protein [Chrysiogenes arsenatis]|uniref:hypothetical protein n=1 Tax=Chrysiogenes arsenatis TaxID=309797 RepID=UPI00041796A2|nr:hypothetical protein [Chrysiogenes arsenatis]